MDKNKAFEHLEYELKMFMTTYRILALQLFGKGPIQNAVLESFLIHTRALLDFLYDKKTYNDDVCAEDYLQEKDAWQKERGEKSSYLDDVSKRTNKLVAHLSYQRLEILAKQSEWQIGLIYQEIIKVFKLFLEYKRRNLPDQERDDKVLEKYDLLLSGTESDVTLNLTAGTTSDFYCPSSLLIDGEGYKVS